MEVFKDIPGYKGLYQASHLGNIKNIKTERILKDRYTNKGYNRVMLYKNRKPKQLSVHRLVAVTFINNPENKLQVNHKNGIRDDNRVENLEWCTASENHKHSYRELGRQVTKTMLGKFGKNNPNSKILSQFTLNGKFITNWDSCKIASDTLGISQGSISMCCNGHRKNTRGFIFKFKKG